MVCLLLISGIHQPHKISVIRDAPIIGR